MKTYTWKYQKSPDNDFQTVFRLYINGFPTWTTVSLEAFMDLRSCMYSLDIEWEIARYIREKNGLSIIESLEATNTLSKTKFK